MVKTISRKRKMFEANFDKSFYRNVNVSKNILRFSWKSSHFRVNEV